MPTVTFDAGQIAFDERRLPVGGQTALHFNGQRVAIRHARRDAHAHARSFGRRLHE
jgi:hypothetical protein